MPANPFFLTNSFRFFSSLSPIRSAKKFQKVTLIRNQLSSFRQPPFHRPCSPLFSPFPTFALGNVFQSTIHNPQSSYSFLLYVFRCLYPFFGYTFYFIAMNPL